MKALHMQTTQSTGVALKVADFSHPAASVEHLLVRDFPIASTMNSRQ